MKAGTIIVFEEDEYNERFIADVYIVVKDFSATKTIKKFDHDATDPYQGGRQWASRSKLMPEKFKAFLADNGYIRKLDHVLWNLDVSSSQQPFKIGGRTGERDHIFNIDFSDVLGSEKP